MDKRMGFDIAYMETHKLGLDDTIQFRCKACGKCCKHRDDVLLTPYDLFRIARFFVRTPLEIIERYCVVYDGKDSHIPLVKIDPVPPDNSCPFLRDKKCIVHKDKPLVCAVYPLARATGPEGPFYVLKPDVKCGSNDRTVSVRDWIGPVRTEEGDQFSVLWFDVINAISRPLHKQWEDFSSERKEEVLTLFYNLLYLGYNTKEDFLSQFKHQATGAML
ncbi:MAG: YkgJ family cysteine cluster protein, partial [Clostridia bacterium]